MANISITAANVAVSTAAVVRREYPAGATITAGQLVYLNAPNQWALVDSDAAVTGNGVNDLCGIALNGASSGQPLAVCTQDLGGFTVGGTLVNGRTYYSSTSAGAIADDVPTTGAFPRVLGVARSAALLVFNPTASGVII